MLNIWSSSFPKDLYTVYFKIYSRNEKKMLSKLVSKKSHSFWNLHSLLNPEANVQHSLLCLCVGVRELKTWTARIPSLPSDLPLVHCVILSKLWGCFIKRGLKYNFQEIFIFKFRVCYFFSLFTAVSFLCDARDQGTIYSTTELYLVPI